MVVENGGVAEDGGGGKVVAIKGKNFLGKKMVFFLFFNNYDFKFLDDLSMGLTPIYRWQKRVISSLLD